MNKFEPTWSSLANYQTPDWFRDAKFGLWAHWGPQCQPARGDWYARGMYQEGSATYKEHLALYGHPSQVGFKDVIHDWKAENWSPDDLVALYKRVGAEYFVAMANHHDNLDLWDSPHQPWNSTAVGPKKNIVAGWAKAAKAQGLRFGVSVHASHAWSWYEPSQGADKEGPHQGVPYDGNLTTEDGAGQWWDGLDPQDLYAQAHPPMNTDFEGFDFMKFWDWADGYPQPSPAYCDKFYQRTIDLIDKYKPDLIYFDDTVLPLHPVSDVGLRIAAHFYNSNPDAVLNGKVLSDEQKRMMVWDIERGASDALEPLPWQTCTCLGTWHYMQSVYDEDGYKSAKTVIHTLVDVVSKNGNLLLSVPLRGDGTPDDKELLILEGIGEWMADHKEAIVGTRPWKIFGEGPASASAQPISAQGFNEGTGIPFTASDIRFTQKGKTLYAFTLGRPTEDILIPSLAQEPITKITQLNNPHPLAFTQDSNALKIPLPPAGLNEIANVFQITLS